MSKQIGVISGRVELNSVEFTKNLAAMKRELRTLKTDTELAKRGFDVFGDGVTGSGNVLKSLENQIQLSGQQMKRYSDDFNKAMKENDGQFTKASQNAQRNFKRMQLEVAKMAEEYYKATLEQERANNKWYQGAKTLSETGDQMQKHGKAVEKIGETWTKVGIAVGLGAGAIMKTAIDFESGVVEMQKTIDTTEAKFYELTQGVRELALEVPMAASELAQLAAIAGQFGIEEDSILSFTETIAGLSVATDLTSESAGMMLAQFANITEMDHSNFENLGSSIVQLGNTMPTTESQIASMAQQLAGAGNAAGMTEADIVGLAGGLSSLGISAERGGSSFSKLIVQMSVASATGINAMADLEAQTGMTRRELELMASNNSKGFRELAQSLGMTTAEMLDAINASKDLEGYASVAGVTVEEFARIFREDAVGAIGMFIDGLAQGNDETGTAIEILDELGITEIRLRDTLLRTGNAQGLLNDAVRASNEAWTENTALAEEADLFYGSTASQLTILRNKIKDVAIELGTALLPVANDFIDGLDPMIDGLKGAAEWFTNLDESTQKLIASATGILIIGGPFVKLLGSTMVGVGKLTSGVGNLGMKLFDVRNKSEALTKTKDMLRRSVGELAGPAGFGGFIKTLGGAGAGAGTAIGGMVLAAGKAVLLTGAIAGITIGVGALIGKLIELGVEGRRNRDDFFKWGVTLDEETSKAVNNFSQLSEQAQESTRQMATDVEKGSADAVNAYVEMADEIVSATEKRTEDINGILVGMSQKGREAMQGVYQEEIAALEQIETDTRIIQENITGIYAKATEENRQLTEEEINIIQTYHNQLAEMRSETLELSAEEQAKVHAAMVEDLRHFSDEQLQVRAKMLHEQYRQEREAYQERYELLEEEVAKNPSLREEMNAEIARLQEEERKMAVNHAAEIVKVQRELGVEERSIREQIETNYKEFGLTYEEVIEQIVGANKRATESSKLFIDTSEMAESRAREAGEAWNNLIGEWDGTEFNVHSNLPEVIEQMLETERGWDTLEFIAKYAPLDTNAKEILLEVMMTNERWWEMEFPEQFAGLDTNAYEVARVFIQSNEEWADMYWEVHDLLVETKTPEVVQESLTQLGIWDKLPDPLKKLIMETEVPQKIREAEGFIDRYGNIHIDPKELDVNDQATPKIKNIERALNNLDGKTANTYSTHTQRTKYVRDYVTTYETHHVGMGNRPLYAQGTDYHKGGPAILGDGGRAEPYLTPQGVFGISPATDTLFDLPKGTKVWSSIQNFSTQLKSSANKIANMEIPKFATGTVDFPNMDELLRPFVVPTNFGGTNGRSNIDLGGIQATLQAILERLSNQRSGGDINIDRIEVQDGEDLLNTMEEMNWILQGEGKRLG